MHVWQCRGPFVCVYRVQCLALREICYPVLYDTEVHDPVCVALRLDVLGGRAGAKGGRYEHTAMGRGGGGGAMGRGGGGRPW